MTTSTTRASPREQGLWAMRNDAWGSPSCGRRYVYDGTFSGTLVEGDGVTAALLMDAGIRVITEEDLGRGGIDTLLD